MFDEELTYFPSIERLIEEGKKEIPNNLMEDWERLLYNVNEKIAKQIGAEFMEVKE